MKKNKKYCPYCSQALVHELEGDVSREYCTGCKTFFYDNPLPVAANIVMKDRKVLLVKRKHDPMKGLWCLPMGFAESGESIESAALRELQEEAGIYGRTLSLVDVESSYSETYGDLLHLTFETEWISGELRAGDDAEDLAFYAFNELPEIAFQSNVNAIAKFIRSKEEYWAILDSFSRSISKPDTGYMVGEFLSDKLVRLVEKNAEVISHRWMEDVRASKSTPTYAKADLKLSLSRNHEVIRHFGDFLGGKYTDNDIRKFYRKLGRERKNEGFALSELISALSLLRKNIWEFALSQGMWNSTIDIYMAIELERRMMLFFDKAAYYISRGYESA